MTIHLLPPEVASQIAAGEVVERPASVVKELLENAVDAGANTITIATEGAGQRLIEVADDGGGISPEDLLMAVERHATSKLQSAEDLFNITTLGFRGEALASIGSVSRLSLTSRRSDEQAGARLKVEGGKVTGVETAGAPVGTVVRVEDLFYNVPARRKFLKADVTERRQIDELVTRYALAYPEIRFKLTQEGRPAVQTSGNGDRREVLAALYGVEIARQMLEVLFEDDRLSISGFISPTSLTRSNRKEITFFVNGRPVHDPALSAALLKGYHTLLMVGRYPLAVLFIEMAPQSVDVNVHPAKAEVRFREPDRVFTGVQAAVRRALLAHTPIPGIEPRAPGFPEPWSAPSPARRQDPDPAWSVWDEWNNTSGSDAGAEDLDTAPIATPEINLPAAQPDLPARGASLLRLIGQIAATYLVAEGPDGLYLVDQHAAHERVLFERFMAQRNGVIPSQALLQPAAVDLPPAAARLLEGQLSVLDRLGFEIEPFGSSTFLVRAMPALLTGGDPAAAVRTLVEDFEEDETPLGAEVEARIIARVCKRAAVKAGQVLSTEEQRSLLHDLESCQSPRTCPHGRPTMIHLSVDLLERQFGRKGAR